MPRATSRFRPYSQAGVNDSDIIGTLDPTKRYILKATSTAGGLQAYASSLDRRNNDLVQVSDDTPRFNVPPDTPVSYYMPGVGRIEDEASNAHWRTDLRVYNPSTLPRTVFLEYHYTPTDATTETIVTKPLSIGAKQGVSIDDVVGNFLDDATDVDLKVGTVLGMLKVTYNAPPDVATAPLIIGGRIYADLSSGTAGMQLSVFTDSQSVAPGSSRLIMPGAQTNLRFRTNIGLFALGTLPTTVRIHAIKQDGTETSSYDFTLNDGTHGAFAQIPMTALPTIDGNPMTIRVEAFNGSRIGVVHRHGRPDQRRHGLHPGQADLLIPLSRFTKGPRKGPFVFLCRSRSLSSRGAERRGTPFKAGRRL